MNLRAIGPQMRTTLFTVITALPVSPLAHASEADEQSRIGAEKAKTCVTCHGADGISSEDVYPNLRGQKKGYLISALKDYKNRQRTSGLAVLMQQQADPLSDQDIEDIAHYYSQLEALSKP